MEQKLWSLALVLALLKIRLDFFHGRTDGDGISSVSQERNPLNFTPLVKLTMEPHPCGSQETVFLVTCKNSFSLEHTVRSQVQSSRQQVRGVSPAWEEGVSFCMFLWARSWEDLLKDWMWGCERKREVGKTRTGPGKRWRSTLRSEFCWDQGS